MAAPTAAAASAIPSSTRCGDWRSRIASLPLAGSDSAPLATTTAAPRRRPRPDRAAAAVTARILRAIGKAAPPRPVSPARSTAAIS